MTIEAKAAYTTKLTGALNKLRKEGQLCNVVITVGEQSFHAHRAILAASSKYFKAMFTSGFQESSAEEVNIDGDPEVFESLLDFAYTGDLKIPAKKAYQVLQMASYLQILDVNEPLWAYVSDNASRPDEQSLPIEDMYLMFDFARWDDDFHGVAVACIFQLCNNVDKLRESDIFLQSAKASFLEMFLQLDKLGDKHDEKKVLNLVVDWLKYDWENRCTHAVNLLGFVRLGLVPEENLKATRADDLLASIPQCRGLLDTLIDLVITQMTSEDIKKILAKKYPCWFTTRSTITAPIALIEPADNAPRDQERTFHYLDKKEQEWVPLPSFRRPPHMAAFITVDNVLYAVGGLDPGYEPYTPQLVSQIKDFYKYNPERNQWEKLPSMAYPHDEKEVHIVSLDGFIYVIGGCDFELNINGVERYDIENGEWTAMARLPNSFIKTSAVAYNGRILVYGMQRAGSRARRRTADQFIMLEYRPETDSWDTVLLDPIPNLYHDDAQPQVFIHNGLVYRVRYKQSEQIRFIFCEDGNCWLNRPCLVNKLNISDRSDRGTIVTVQEKIKQDLIPSNGCGAFRIHDDVFVNMKGRIVQTDVAIKEDQTEDVDVQSWLGVVELEAKESNMTNFTFDKNVLAAEELF